MDSRPLLRNSYERFDFLGKTIELDRKHRFSLLTVILSALLSIIGSALVTFYVKPR